MKLFRYLLFPFSVLYNLITSVRNLFFDKGFFKETQFNLPVIVVGNLSVGGTGKTPQIEYLIRLLKDSYKTVVLSRGYKRKSKGFIIIDDNHSHEDVGDEPLQYFKKYSNINVAVDADRVNGICNLIEKKSPEVILLDDAYQHRKVKGSFNVLITKYGDLFNDDFLLPTGNLRESRRGANRADVILVSKCPDNLSVLEQDKIRKKLSNYKKKLFFTSISYANKLKGASSLTIGQLNSISVLLITGIANPTPLLQFLETKNVNFEHLKYPDHHNFSSDEIAVILEKYNRIKGDKIILTTEKDFTRLQYKIKALSYIEIETSFLNSSGEEFNSVIINHIKSFKNSKKS